MNNRVGELFDIIRKAEDELASIRANCEHKVFSIGMWSTGPGRFYPSRICAECKYWIDGITAEETKEVWDGWHKANSAFQTLSGDKESK